MGVDGMAVLQSVLKSIATNPYASYLALGDPIMDKMIKSISQ